MSKLLCVACNDEAYYIFLGKSLCKYHFGQWAKRYDDTSGSDEWNEK